eukprot:gene1657-3206_t
MSGRLIDIIVYGASGFTGKKVARYLYLNQRQGLVWAIAGRSESKLSSLLNDLKEIETSVPSVNLPSSLVADVADTSSLCEVFSKAKLVLNCTGPYRFLGAPIVEACITAGTDYMDISGEPQFMEESFLRFHESAQSKKVLVLHACAFDSVPADLGCLYVMRQYAPRCCSSIESFLSLNCGPEGIGGHYTTYECAVHGIGDIQSLRKVRSAVEEKYTPPKLKNNGIHLKKNTGFYFENRIKKYAFPFMGADASVVRSSQRALAMRTGETTWPQYGAYATVDSWGWMTLTSLYGAVFKTLSGFSLGRSLLLQYPETFTNGMFSHKGPTETQLETTSFSMTFFSKGFSLSQNAQPGAIPDKEVVAKVSGPEPGYVATPAIFVALAYSLLDERNTATMPVGGVLTPTAAFYDNVSVFDNLTKAGIKFEVEGSPHVTTGEQRSNL